MGLIWWFPSSFYEKKLIFVLSYPCLLLQYEFLLSIKNRILLEQQNKQFFSLLHIFSSLKESNLSISQDLPSSWTLSPLKKIQNFRNLFKNQSLFIGSDLSSFLFSLPFVLFNFDLQHLSPSRNDFESFQRRCLFSLKVL